MDVDLDELSGAASDDEIGEAHENDMDNGNNNRDTRENDNAEELSEEPAIAQSNDYRQADISAGADGEAIAQVDYAAHSTNADDNTDEHYRDTKRARTENDDNDSTKRGDNAPRMVSALSKAECFSQFNEMLVEANPSPFAAWETEELKLRSDDRFKLISDAKERRKLFDKFCETRASRVTQLNQEATKKSREAYLSLLQTEIKNQMRFSDFNRTFRRDPRFEGFNNIREREALFNAHIEKIKQAIAGKRQEAPTSIASVDKRSKEEASLQERANAVRRQQSKLQRTMHESLGKMKREEAETEFNAFLSEVVKTHT
eukprot:jgi/Hompol1/5906/HPOL_000342-RA